MNKTIIQARNIHVQHDQLYLLQAVDLSLQAEQIVTIIGPSGAGKTILIEVLLGLRRMASGTIWRVPNLRLGYMPQHFSIATEIPLSVARFLSLNERKIPPPLRKEVLDLTGVGELLTHSLTSVSGGELQWILLARALLRQPRLLVLDEPAQGMDVVGQAEFYRLLGDIRTRWSCAILLVSHDLHLVMAAADEVLCLNRHVCCQGHPESVSQHPEYRKLFSSLPLDGLAVYQHHHDHRHDWHGEETLLEKSTKEQHDG